MKTEQIDAQDLPVMLSDAAWQSLHPFLKTLPTAPEACRRFVGDNQRRRDLAVAAESLHAIYRRFGRWCDAGVFEKLHEHFHEAGDFSALLIDSTIVRAHSSAAGAPKKNGQPFRSPLKVALPRECCGE